ncbi:hypothetical protein BTZ20_5804 [Rhodococcus sp. MTM3W5.2]|nr:hypothetical protein BTZ20_5804 [Rhodococcus sp. MTM3W5.2]
MPAPTVSPPATTAAAARIDAPRRIMLWDKVFLHLDVSEPVAAAE